MNAPARLRHWRENPVAFVRDQFGVEPDAWQADALMAFANPAIPRISMQACAGPGKSAVVAWMICNFLGCYAGKNEHPKGFACSVTSDNLSSNLWPEVAKWIGRSPFMREAFVWTAERVFARAHPATWFVSARSWPKTASPEEQGKTLSGLHGEFVAAFIDESGSIPTTVLRAAEQALSTKPKFGKIVQAGNPLSLDGMLYAASTQLAHLWHIIRITGDPDDPKRSPRIDADWARQQIEANGRDNPWVMAYILGQFPPASLNALLGPDEVREAMARNIYPDEHAACVLGVDVAREGDDRSVMFPRQGQVAMQPVLYRNLDSLQGAGQVARKAREWPADAIFIDNTGGFGGGWIDQLRVLGFAPVGVQFAGKPTDIARYANKRAEMWFAMADWVKAGGALPNVPELVAELTTPTYAFKGDKMILEDKVQIKKRLGRSPDLADALALTFAAPVQKVPRIARVAAQGRQGSINYDPFQAAGL